ncbi:MAG TPA: rhombosortase [Candidatus Tenderia sp.]|nr:rhombosortase [Candidatus Tenderia sp.]
MPNLKTYTRQLQHHWLPLLLALLSLLIATLGDPANLLLRYDQEAIRHGQWWRFLTANLTHLGWSHTLLNLIGLALIWGLFARVYATTNWLIITLVSSLGVTLGLLLFNPHIEWYVGLSGLLHGLFVAGVIGAIRQGHNREALLLVAIAAKLIWEQVSGPLPGTSEMTNGPVIVDSHLYGAIAGGLIALLVRPSRAQPTD